MFLFQGKSIDIEVENNWKRWVLGVSYGSFNTMKMVCIGFLTLAVYINWGFDEHYANTEDEWSNFTMDPTDETIPLTTEQLRNALCDTEFKPPIKEKENGS